MRAPPWAAAALLPLAACSPAPDDGRALSADQEARLNAAAEMPDANSVALEEVGGNHQDQPR